MQTIYTIGHSLHSYSYFLRLLTQFKINCILDVRSTPYSKHAPQYNMHEIRHFLKTQGMYYIFMGEEFGARRSDKTLFAPEGYLDFDKVMNSALFKSGIERVENGLEQGFNIAIMCTEKDPIDCHRSILVARAFHLRNYNVTNILGNGKTETQKQLEERMLDLYFPERNQRTLSDYLNGETTNEVLLAQAYKFKNRDIGYRYKADERSNII